MNEFQGKWIAVYPSTYGRYGLGRLRILYVHKETTKQVLAGESKSLSTHLSTVQKNSILQVVPEDAVDTLRTMAMNTQNSYDSIREKLFNAFLETTVSGILEVFNSGKNESLERVLKYCSIKGDEDDETQEHSD